MSLDYEGTRVCPECSGKLVLTEGSFTTCGGLQRRRALVCNGCRVAWITRLGDNAELAGELPPGPWVIASSGVSLDIGPVRVRLEGGGSRELREKIIRAIAKLPELLTLEKNEK